MELSLLRVLREEQKKNVVIYGSSMRCAGLTREEIREFNIREWDMGTGKGTNADAIILMKQLIAHRDIFAELQDYCRRNNAEVFDIHGHRLGQICERAKKRGMCNRKELMEQIAVHDCVSFDLFDTLLTRKVLSPEDVFDLVDRKLCQEGIRVRNFKKKRLKAQEELGLSNPTLYDIYRKFSQKYRLSEEIVQRCMETELLVESSVLTPRQDMLAIYEECIAKGKKVSLVTDMYIPEKLLFPILERNGIGKYDRLYVSCDRKQLKLQGLLQTYRKETKGTKYLHIGDHFIHDGICAELADMDYCLIASGYALAVQSVYSACIEQARSLEEHIMLGMLFAKLFNSPFDSPAEKNSIAIFEDYDYGYYFCAPLISLFVVWLYNQFLSHKFDNVLFASRDGYLIKKLYEILCNEKESFSAPSGIYFYTSRKATVMTNINNESYINMLIDISQQMAPQEMMRNFFGLDKKDILEYDKEKYDDSIHKYVWDHLNAILVRSNLAKMNYYKYMGRLSLKIGAKYAFMDFVSSGTSQKSLARIAPFELYGFYAGWNGTENKEEVGVQALFEGEESFFIKNYKIMETFMTSEEPSLSHFDEEGQPVFSGQDRRARELVYVNSMQRACEDYFRELLEIMIPVEEEIDKGFVDMLFAISAKAFVVNADSFLNHMNLMDNWRKKRNKLSRTI